MTGNVLGGLLGHGDLNSTEYRGRNNYHTQQFVLVVPPWIYLSSGDLPRFLSLENLALAGALFRWIFWWKQHRYGTSHLSLMAWMGKKELVEADWDGYKAACTTEVEKLATGDDCVVARHFEEKARGPQPQVLSEDGESKKRLVHVIDTR
jgi:hypothetical protein